MLIQSLIHSFVQEKKYSPLHTNDLLDYVQKLYVLEDLSIVEYKKLFFELDKLKAEKPQAFVMKSTIPYETIDLPS